MFASLRAHESAGTQSSGVLVVSEEGEIVRADEQAARILRRRPRSLEAMSIADVLGSLAQLAQRAGPSCEGEVAVVAPNGDLLAIGYTLGTTRASRHVDHVLVIEDLAPVDSFRPVDPLHSRTLCAVDLEVRRACRLLERVAWQRGVIVNVVPHEIPFLRLERSAVCDLVVGLVKIAIDASARGGEVSVSVELVGSVVVFVVADASDATRDDALETFAEVAQASGGTLVAKRHPTGTVVTVSVPALSPTF